MPLKHSTNYLKNPMIPMPQDRPRCGKRGCQNPRAIIGTLNDGSPSYRKVCSKHHGLHVAEKNGAKSMTEVTASRQGLTVTQYQTKILKKAAQQRGFSTVTDYLNSRHPYRQHRKDRCENRDGRLGFKCNYKIRHPAQLQVDHIDGNHINNDISNLQTLCANCHTYKSHVSGDLKTPGRKTRTKSA